MRKQSNISFVDLAFCLVFGFVLLFTVAVTQLNVKLKEADIEANAEFIITLTWQEGHDHDVDMWVRDPQENLLFFRTKEVGIMHLDRDDLGNTNDTYEEDGEVKIVRTNQEIVTIRGFMTGEWILNTHFYRVSKNLKDEKVARCNVVVTRLNPKAKIVINKSFILSSYWEEKTIARLMMTASGDIFIEDPLPAQLVKNQLSMLSAQDTYE